MDRRDRQTTVHGVTESQTRLSDEHFHFSLLVFNSGVSVKKKNQKPERPETGAGVLILPRVRVMVVQTAVTWDADS